MHIYNEISYTAHLLPRGYFQIKIEMIVINIVKVIEQKLIHLQTDKQMDKVQQVCFVWGII